jgi:hypothetical protein
MPRTNLLSVLVAAAALAACDGPSPTGGAEAGLTQAEAQELASAWDEVGAGVMDGFGGPSESVLPGDGPARATVTIQFNSTRACPQGGTATVQGSREVTRDGQGSGSVQLAATRTDAACTFQARRGTGTLTLTTTPSVQLTSRQTWTNGQPGTRTSTQKGSFDWSRSANGATGSCTVDLTATWTPATRTYTLDGTFCDRTVSVTRTRTG